MRFNSNSSCILIIVLPSGVLMLSLMLYFLAMSMNLFSKIFFPSPHEFYIRSIIVVLFFLVAFFARTLLIKQESISQELEKHINNLQGLVCMRTKQLEEMASIDDLTKIYSHRNFFELAQYEIDRNVRQ